MRKLLFILLLSPLFSKAQSVDTIPNFRVTLHYLCPQGQQPNYDVANDSSEVIITVSQSFTVLRAIYWAKHHLNDDGTQPYIGSKFIRIRQGW